ncbi:MAG: threonine synthase [Caldisericia bacterium]|nr:threonine synthase [Caldisericia bacterium]
MAFVKKLKCVLCGSEYSPDEVTYTCPKCGYDGILEVIYDYEKIKENFSLKKLKERPLNIWRYMELLPVEEGEFPPLSIGWTPLYEVKRLREKLNLKNLFIKDDGKNPTASLKDRASAVAVKKAMEIGAKAITTASTGNAASSLAGVSASVGLPSFIFVPRNAPKAKIAQLLVFGSTVFSVNGTYDDAFDLCIKTSEEFGWYNRNTAFNPYTLEGKKTVSLEIWEQLGGKAPDKVFVSVGDGVIYGGVYKGFYDLYALGLIDKIPEVIGVQAEGSAPIVKAFNEGKERVTPLKNPKTIADSISVGIPRNGTMALKYARKWNGKFISVSDEEILSAIPFLGKLTGVFGEPAGVTGLAGLLKMLKNNEIDRDEVIVVIVTGNGLKDVESAMKSVGEPILVENSFEDVKRKIKNL